MSSSFVSGEMASTNVDPRGTARGHCTTDDCDCLEYEYVPETKPSSCTFCGCPPTKHAKLTPQTER